jgi:3-oxoacyl-[acyl-carrier-protein] synthase III
LLVGASRESYLLDYENERSRFMLNFGDGAVAALLVAGHDENELLGSFGITDGSLALQVKVAVGGSVAHSMERAGERNGQGPVLDVADPAEMKARLDIVSLPNFLAAADGALTRSGLKRADVSYLCTLHMKRSMHDALAAAVGVQPARAPYLEDTGHISGVDTLLALDRAARGGDLHEGDVVLLLAAGTGYTWAASVVRWGSAMAAGTPTDVAP